MPSRVGRRAAGGRARDRGRGGAATTSLGAVAAGRARRRRRRRRRRPGAAGPSRWRCRRPRAPTSAARRLRAGEDDLGVGAQGGQLVPRRRIGVQVGVGEQRRADGDRGRPRRPRRQRPHGDLRRAAADVDDRHAPGGRRALGRAGEGEARLLEPVEHVDLDARARAHRRAQRLGVVGGPDRGGGDDPDPLRAELRAPPSPAARRCRPASPARPPAATPERSRSAAQAGEGLLRRDLAQAPRVHVGDEDAGGVGADVDAGAAHTLTRGLCLPPSRSAGCARPTGSTRPCAASTSASPAARSSACSGPTARARRRPSRSSRATASATAGEVRVLGLDPGRPRRATCASASASCCRAAACTATSPCASPSPTGPASTPPRATSRRRSPSSASPRQADQRTRTLSGGQQRRLDFALALIGDPELIFLDEPTTGFDPEARRTAWDTVRSLRDLGKTVLLTTHYLDEAQALADRVAIVKEGAIVAEGPPGELGAERHALPRSAGRADGERVVHETEDPTRLLQGDRAALARGDACDDARGHAGPRWRTSTWSSRA